MKAYLQAARCSAALLPSGLPATAYTDCVAYEVSFRVIVFVYYRPKRIGSTVAYSMTSFAIRANRLREAADDLVLCAYGALQAGGKNARERRNLALYVLGKIAGSLADTEMLIKDLAGHKNYTMDSILEAYDDIGGSRSELARGRRSMILYPLRRLPFPTVRRIGFSVGKDLWRSVCNFNPFLDEPLLDKRRTSSGRKRTEHASAIEEGWRSHAHPSGSGPAVFHGLKKDAASTIKASIGANSISRRTVLRYKPPEISRAARPRDMCPICEELKARRRRLQGGHYGHGQPDCVSRESDTEAIAILELHERFADKQRLRFNEEMRRPPNGTLVVAVDWASAIELASFRGNAHEFFDPATVQMAGAWASWKDGSDEVRRIYVHAYDNVNSPRPKTAAFTCAVVCLLVRQVVRSLDVAPQRVSLWCDTAQHFRNKLIFADLPATLLHNHTLDSATINFHVEHHGKTCLDGSFRRAREWTKLYIDYATLKRGEVGVADALSLAYNTAEPEERYEPIMIPDFDEWPAKEVVFDCIRKISRVHVDCANKYKITYAGGKTRGPMSMVTVAAGCNLGADPPQEHKLLTKGEKQSYVEDVKKKFS